MAKELQTASIVAPAFWGLNLQDSSVSMDSKYALKADNCIIDSYGRLGSRKGWRYVTQQLNGVDDANAGINLLGMHKHTDNAGTERYISWSATTFYREDGNLIPITPTTTDTISTGAWHAATLNDATFFFQEGYKPLYYTTAGTFQTVDLHADYSGTVPVGSFVLSAYGRLWVVKGSKVYFSDLLTGFQWDTGTAGYIDISSVFPKDSDTITGLGAHNGTLVIFCRNSIIIYGDRDNLSGNFDPTSMTLIEAIKGVGCVAHDTIAQTGSDIVFLSSTGVRSLGRTIVEKSQPLGDYSVNVHDTLIADMGTESQAAQVKGVYAPKYSFYLLRIPNTNVVYCFDTRTVLDNGGWRATTWSGLSNTSYYYDHESNELLMTDANGIAIYDTFLDNGNTYVLSYLSNYFDLGSPTTNKVMKNIRCTVIGASGQTFLFRSGHDYKTDYRNFAIKLDTQGDIAYYNVDEYGLAEYNGGINLQSIRVPIGGQGEVLQGGIDCVINSRPLSIQKLDMYLKVGRTY